MSEPQYTVLRKRHEARGATFTDFGGWMMPVRYTSDLAEHAAVREAAGLFDISHMSEFVVDGPTAPAFLDFACAGAISAMNVGKAKYTLLLNEEGGILDDLIVYRLAEDRFLIIANAGNRDVVAQALTERNENFKADLDDITDDVALIAVQGPKARTLLEKLHALQITGVSLEALGYYAWTEGDFQDAPVFIARTGYTGEDGFELLVPNSVAARLWDSLAAAGESLGLVPAGLAARDTLRLEAGMPLYGHELSEHTRPAQVGLSRVVGQDKPAFVGREALVATDDAAPVLVGLVLEGKRAARAGYEVFAGEDLVGVVTSGALSPTLGFPIAMALVRPDVAQEGTALAIDVRGTKLPATITALPFYRRNA